MDQISKASASPARDLDCCILRLELISAKSEGLASSGFECCEMEDDATRELRVEHSAGQLYLSSRGGNGAK